MRLRLTPREDGFYDLFADSANNLVTGARLLVGDHQRRLGPGSHGREDARLRARRRRAHPRDHAPAQLELHHARSTARTSTSSPRPRRRHGLHGGGRRPGRPLPASSTLPEEVVRQVELLERAAELTAEAMPRLRTMKDLSEYWIEINRLENQADKRLPPAARPALQRRVRRAGGDEAQGGRRPARGGGRRVRARRQHGRDDRGQGILSRVDALRSHSSSSSWSWRWSSTTPTASTTPPTPSRPRSRPGR